MNKSACRILVWLIVSFTMPAAWAIQLDASFGDSGYVQTNISAFNGYNELTPRALLQTDGKIVIAGVSNDNLALIRYNVDGTMDTGFGVNGWVTNTAVVLGQDGVAGLVEQSDGKIVVAAVTSNATSDIVLFRYNSNGTIDGSFGIDGLVTTDFFGDELAYSIIRQADGKLVVSGVSGNQMSLIRYTSNGVLDTGFGAGGVAALAINGTHARAVVQQSDGRLVAAGGGHIARFHTNGALDLGFDTDGWNTIPATVAFAVNLALQANGQLVIVGFTTGGAPDIAVVRFNANGGLDAGFGTAGVATTDVGGNEIGFGIVPNIVDSKIVVTGQSDHGGGDTSIVVLRYDADGTLDTSFSTDGIVELDLGIYRDYAQSIVQQSNGRYVLAGQTADGANSDFVTIRYNGDGTLDSTFDTNGYKIDWLDRKTIDVATSLVAQSDGKLVAAGRTVYSADRLNLNEPADMALTRYQTNGDLDSVFADDGRLVRSLVSPHTGVRHLIRQVDDKLVSLVETYDGSSSLGVLMRHDVDGGIDMTFGSSGVATLNSRPITGIQQLDGKLVVYLANSELRRFDNLGKLDLGFGISGVIVPGVGGLRRYSIVEQSGGKLVIAGVLGLERYTESGVLDTTFGAGGQILFSDSIYAPMIVKQTDGKLLVGYFLNNGEISTSDPTLTIMRFSADGVLDTSFGDSGVVTTQVDDDIFGVDSVHKLALQDDGKLVVFVRIDSFEFKLARYNTNGSLDTSFDSDGIFDLPFTVSNTGGTVLDGDMVYRAGEFYVLVANQSDFFTAKFVEIEVPPVAGAVVATNVIQANDGETSYSLNIDYSDANGDLEILSIQASNIAVCNGGSCAVVTAAVWSGDTASGTATYSMTPPGGSWDITDSGAYTIAILPAEVGDSLSTYVEDNANAGSFTVSITPPLIPDAPVITAAIPANMGALIEFTANFSSAPIIDFTATCTGGSNATGSNSPLLVTGLTNDTMYDCSVIANGSEGASPASNVVSVTPSDGGEVILPPPGGGSGEPVTFTHTAIPPGGGDPVVASLLVTATASSPPAPPPEADSLVAAIDISSTSEVSGYTLVVTFSIDTSSVNEFVGFWKYGKETSGDTPHWYDYGTLTANGDGTGFEISADKKSLTIYLIDGERGDDDWLVNASIVDPALPLVQVTPIPTCNVNIVSGITEFFDVTHEACDILAIGPDFIAAAGSNISANSGWEIEFLPGFILEQGATLRANVCGQSLCMTSPSPMPVGCHTCVDQICAIDSSCCELEFDGACLDKVDTVCGLVCD